MKKQLLYFLTSITSIWLIAQLLSGFKITGRAYEVLILGTFIVLGIYITEYILEKSGKTKDWVFLLIATLVNFFIIYIANLLLTGINIVSGSLQALDLQFLATPTISQIDVILTLLIAAFVTAFIAWLTKWSTR